jgi:subtilase family serine protease
MIYNLALLSLAGAACVNGLRLEADSKIPSKWINSGDNVEHKQIELTFALKLRNTQELHDKLLSVSSPSSSSYGKLLSLEEVNAMTNPSDNSIEKVKAYIRSFGAKTISYSSGFLRTTVDVDVAQKMLAADYNAYTHAETGEVAIRCSHYELPDDLASLLDFVAPSTNNHTYIPIHMHVLIYTHLIY